MLSQYIIHVANNILLKLIFLRRHNDLPWNVRKFVHNQLGEVNLSSDLGRVDPWARSDWSHTDIPRLRAGLVGAQVNSTWHSLNSPSLLSVGRYFHLAFSAKMHHFLALPRSLRIKQTVINFLIINVI